MTTLENKHTRIKAVGYVRVSTDKQELSPDAQREVIQRWAQLNDIDIIAVQTDIGYSGGTPWVERPGLTEAVNLARRHGASWLVVAAMDRLSRDLYNMLHLQRELESFNARVISATERPTEEETPENVLSQQIVGAFAQFEKAKIRSRIKAALAVRKQQGVRLGSLPLEATEHGRCIIWAVWYLKDRGYGAKRIAERLNAYGAVGPKGGQQHYRNIQRLLKQPRPTDKPRAWSGLDKTWEKFTKNAQANRDGQADPHRDRSDLRAARRQVTSARDTSADSNSGDAKQKQAT